MFTRSVGTSFWNPAVIRRQFPLLQEQRKKRDGSLQQSYRCHFIFVQALRRSSTCEPYSLRTPSNPLRPHMKLSRCTGSGVGAARPRSPIPAYSRRRILSACGRGSLAVHRERYVPQPYLPPCHRHSVKIPFLWRMGLVGTKRIELLTSRLSIVCSTN